MSAHRSQIRNCAGLLIAAIAIVRSISPLAASPLDESAANWVVYAPLPQYPSSAQRQLIRETRGAYMAIFRGDPKGIFLLRVKIKTGCVKEVIVARSTGERTLDLQTVQALKQWRF